MSNNFRKDTGEKLRFVDKEGLEASDWVGTNDGTKRCYSLVYRSTIFLTH